MSKRIYLSPPHMSGQERKYVEEAFDTNWVAPLGPNVDQFETEFCERVGAGHAAALSSGTAALHLALILVGVEPGDEVLVSSMTFVASVNPIRYVGAVPILVDCDRASWNLDPDLVEEAIRDRIEKKGRPPKAVIAVHLYGQSAHLDRIAEICARYDVALVEDAAEALGAVYYGSDGPESGRSVHPGTVGRVGIFSFNGNKIITTSGGGMLVSDDAGLVAQARKLSTQARDDAPHYQHSEIGFNYRMSNIVAGIGRGQLEVLDDRVAARSANFQRYHSSYGDWAGIEFQPQSPWGTHTRWLTCAVMDAKRFGSSPEELRLAFERDSIEARPLWKPMHMQPLYRECEMYGGSVAEELFAVGICLPSGSALDDEDWARIDAVMRSAYRP